MTTVDYKEMLRDELIMLEDNISNLNAIARKHLVEEDVRQKISDIRWYVSHGTYQKDRPQLPAGKSKPPITWLYAQVHGLTTPLSKDLGLCIAPVPASSVMTEQAAKRIFNALTYPLYSYMSAEDITADREASYKRRVKDPQDRATHAEEQRRSKAKLDREKKLAQRTPQYMDKKAKQYQEEKDRQREKERKEREKAAEEARKKGKGIREAMKQAVKDRRKEFGD